VNRPKAVFKRPWLHHFIIIAYIAAPFVNILLLRLFANVPFAIIFSRLVAGYGALATAWLITAPLVGITLYFVTRISWYIFLGHSSLILLDFIIKWASRPAYYLHTIPGGNNILILAGNLVLVGVIGYIIQRDFRSPYLQVLNRNWRERKRIPIYHAITLDGAPRTVTDLSTGGCFVAEEGSTRALGSRVRLTFTSDSLKIDCAGEVMRTTPGGCGIRFIGLPGAKKREIGSMLRRRFALRHMINLPVSFLVSGEEREAVMVDLSRGGCYLKAETASLSPNDPGALRVEIPDSKQFNVFHGTVVWINSAGENRKPVGFGFQFLHVQRRFLRIAVARYGKGALIR
jgi:hypothetical protein